MSRSGRLAPQRRSTLSRIGPTLLLVGVLLTGGCTGGAGEDGDPPDDTDDPEVESAAPLEAYIRQQTPAADLFPPTATRTLVLNHCGSCHAVACTALGQRSRTRWREVELSHESYIPGLSAEDRGRIFDYLARHFNDTLPEPQVPPELLSGGCPTL